jgi:alpha-L-rhamnosidase
MKILVSACVIAAFSINCFAQPNLQTRVTSLKCEYLEKPLGIDASNPRLSWQMDDSRQEAAQKAYRVLIGTDSLEVVQGKGSVWNSGKIKSNAILVTYPGSSLRPFTRYYWSVACRDKDGRLVNSEVSAFETGFMQNAVWKGSWISDGINKDLKPAPYFRKGIEITKRVKTARAYIAVAGLYELYINGEKTGNHRLDPMYTRFDRRTLYVTYDVTSQLRQGKNAIGVILGNGWYNHQSTAVWYFHQAPWRARPAFCMDLRITYEDGSVETIVTGNDWKTSTGGLIFNSIYTAEHFDNRLEPQGWNTATFDDSKWRNAELRPAPSRHIVAQALHPIRNVEKISSKSIQKINDSTYVFNLGRNISGVSEFTIDGDSGMTFRLKHGERIYENGRVDMANIDVHYRPTDDKDPFQTDIFILNGKGRETFIPRFNYKGFQYVEVTCNKPVNLTTANLKGYFMHSDVPPVGKISSSNPMINQLWWATNNSYLSNLFGYPTDCPQREKNGWTGDAHIASETGLYNFDAITVYEKWLADHRDEQQPNGVLPAIIPTSGWGYQWANGLDWTSTIAIIPWNVYLFYGDSKLLADCYDNIKRYVDHIAELYPTGLTTWGLGDWVPVKSQSPVELTSSAYYFTDVTILANAAKLFSKQSDYEKYAALAAKIKDAVNAKYLNKETGIYGKGTQTEMSFPLFWNIVPIDQRSKVAANLAKRAEADNFHLDVGLLGTKTILNALSEHGYADVAYKIAAQETFPSWGWWIKNGATTLYENWPLDAKSDISLNHIMFGEVGAWMYKGLGGIYPDPEAPGFKNILLKPAFPEGLDSFAAEHQSPYGKIVSSWKKDKSLIVYKVVVPANSSAKLSLPTNYEVKNLTAGTEIKDDMISLKAGTYELQLEKGGSK